MIVVWIAVVKHHFFDVDFVVSRALVYTAITAAVIGIVGGSEELLTYIFYNNTNLAYGLIIAISLGHRLHLRQSQGRSSSTSSTASSSASGTRSAPRSSASRPNLLDAEDAEAVVQRAACTTCRASSISRSAGS